MAGLMTAYRWDVTYVLTAQMACPTHKFLFAFAKCHTVLYLLRVCGGAMVSGALLVLQQSEFKVYSFFRKIVGKIQKEAGNGSFYTRKKRLRIGTASRGRKIEASHKRKILV